MFNSILSICPTPVGCRNIPPWPCKWPPLVLRNPLSTLPIPISQLNADLDGPKEAAKSLSTPKRLRKSNALLVALVKMVSRRVP